MEFDQLLLNRLIERYENSAHYRKTSSNRRVLLRLGPDSRDLPEYMIENYEVRQTVHAVVLQLAAEGLIGYEWVRYQQDNVLSEVWLVLDRVRDAYFRLGRTPGVDVAQEILMQIDKLLQKLEKAEPFSGWPAVNLEWILPALLDMRHQISTTLKLNPLLPVDPKLAYDLLFLLDHITRPDFNETSLRILSTRCFHDSKHFERNLRSRVVSLLRRYHPQLAGQDREDLSADDDLLTLAGIFRNPEIFEFCGPLQLTFKNSGIENSTINFKIFTAGACLSSGNLKSLMTVNALCVRRVLLIENRTNYEDYIQAKHNSDELVIYHGGFHSLAKLRFLKLIIAALQPAVMIDHWGDIDLGGMRIFLQIRQVIAPQLAPWRMDKDTLIEHQKQAIPFSQAYRRELERALDDPAFHDFHEVLSAMLELGVRLEQEALLTQS